MLYSLQQMDEKLLEYFERLKQHEQLDEWQTWDWQLFITNLAYF